MSEQNQQPGPIVVSDSLTLTPGECVSGQGGQAKSYFAVVFEGPDFRGFSMGSQDKLRALRHLVVGCGGDPSALDEAVARMNAAKALAPGKAAKPRLRVKAV